METLILDSEAEVLHTGSICSGSKVADIDSGINDFVFIENNLVVVEGSDISVGSHSNITCSGVESHEFTFETMGQDFIFVEDKLIAIVGDGYSSDTTLSTNSGNNDFVYCGG